MSEPFRPADAAGVREVVAWAAAEAVPLAVAGWGSKELIGRPAQAERTLSLSYLSGLVLYEPEELVLSVKAGTPMAEVDAALSDANQMLAFEPVDVGPLLGLPAGGGTVGGLFATNLSGPRRVKAGAVRDHMLGLEAVSGRGEVFRAGGRVVKNVTGYDLARGLTGSWGTLAVATELTLKVLPAPETEASLAIFGLDDRAGVAALCQALGSPAEVSGAAHLPAPVADRIAPLGGPGAAATLIRLEGFGPSVEARLSDLETALKAGGGTLHRLDREASRAAWRAVRDALAFAQQPERAIWRVSVAPTAGPAVAAAARAAGDAEAFFDWSGGLVWLSVAEAAGGDGLAAAIRAAVAANGGGHATLIRGSAELRTRILPFEPQSPALAALAGRLKEQFDPRGILNPGRMTPGP